MHGVCHMEICTADLEKSKAFLGALFGWEFTDFSPAYALYKTPDGPGGGLQKMDEMPGKGDVSIYIEVASIDETLAKAQELGGGPDQPKTEIGGGHGFYASLQDPGGAVLGIWQASE